MNLRSEVSIKTDAKVTTLGKGRYFGEVGLIARSDARRTGTATATTRSLFVTIDAVNFDKIFVGSNCLGTGTRLFDP